MFNLQPGQGLGTQTGRRLAFSLVGRTEVSDSQSGVSRLLRSQDALHQTYIKQQQIRIQEEEEILLFIKTILTKGLI